MRTFKNIQKQKRAERERRRRYIDGARHLERKAIHNCDVCKADFQLKRTHFFHSLFL